MANRKGNVTNPKGRGKGTPNRSTGAAKHAIARFVDNNAPLLQKWLEEVYKEEGARAALELFAKYIEFHVPKLARKEIAAEIKADIMKTERLIIVEAGAEHMLPAIENAPALPAGLPVVDIDEVSARGIADDDENA